MQRQMLRKAGPAQASQRSSDQGMSKGGCATVRVSARQVLWAPEDRCYPWTSMSRLFLGTAESLSSVQLLSELALGRHAKSPFSHGVVDKTDVPIDFRLLGGC